MADPGKTFYDIVRALLDDDWRDAFIAELGDDRGAGAIVSAAARTNDRLGGR